MMLRCSRQLLSHGSQCRHARGFPIFVYRAQIHSDSQGLYSDFETTDPAKLKPAVPPTGIVVDPCYEVDLKKRLQELSQNCIRSKQNRSRHEVIETSMLELEMAIIKARRRGRSEDFIANLQQHWISVEQRSRVVEKKNVILSELDELVATNKLKECFQLACASVKMMGIRDASHVACALFKSGNKDDAFHFLQKFKDARKVNAVGYKLLELLLLRDPSMKFMEAVDLMREIDEKKLGFNNSNLALLMKRIRPEDYEKLCCMAEDVCLNVRLGEEASYPLLPLIRLVLFAIPKAIQDTHWDSAANLLAAAYSLVAMYAPNSDAIGEIRSISNNAITEQIQLRIILDAKRWDLLTDFSNYAGLWMSAKVFKRKLLKAGGDVYISPKTCRIRGQLGVELLVGASEHAKEIANAIAEGTVSPKELWVTKLLQELTAKSDWTAVEPLMELRGEGQQLNLKGDSNQGPDLLQNNTKIIEDYKISNFADDQGFESFHTDDEKDKLWNSFLKIEPFSLAGMNEETIRLANTSEEMTGRILSVKEALANKEYSKVISEFDHEYNKRAKSDRRFPRGLFEARLESLAKLGMWREVMDTFHMVAEHDIQISSECITRLAHDANDLSCEISDSEVSVHIGSELCAHVLGGAISCNTLPIWGCYEAGLLNLAHITDWKIILGVMRCVLWDMARAYGRIEGSKHPLSDPFLGSRTRLGGQRLAHNPIIDLIIVLSLQIDKTAMRNISKIHSMLKQEFYPIELNHIATDGKGAKMDNLSGKQSSGIVFSLKSESLCKWLNVDVPRDDYVDDNDDDLDAEIWGLFSDSKISEEF